MQQALELLAYASILIFGVAVSAIFSGFERSPKNILIICCFSAATLFCQGISWQFLGLELTKALYPFIVHLPLVIILKFAFKKTWLVSLSSVFSAYLCCQSPKWLSSIIDIMFKSKDILLLIYIPIIAICFLVLYKYIATPVSRVMAQSWKSCFLFGAVPFLYYIFDYVSTIYTNWLYSGSVVAVQFIPSMVSIFYFVFVLIYYSEVQKNQAVQRERDLIAAELKEAKTEFDALSRIQEQTRRYRHDMRHHFTLLQGLAADGDINKITDYLKIAKSDLDALTPTKYCENDTINLLLSSFHTAAEQAGVVLSVEAGVPKTLSISDTELCSLLSNSLENAVTAASAVVVQDKRIVDVRITIHKEKLLLSVVNPYVGEIVMKQGVPQSSVEGHGYGTRSISAIAELHGGQAIFTAENGMFFLHVMVPLK